MIIALTLAVAVAAAEDPRVALAREAVRRDERALAEHWRRGLIEQRELRRRFEEERRLALARRQLGRRALEEHLRQARRELERLLGKR